MEEGGWMDERRYGLEAEGVEEGEEKGEEKEKEDWRLWGVKLTQVV
jgi:hypothetical protein